MKQKLLFQSKPFDLLRAKWQTHKHGVVCLVPIIAITL